MGEWSYHTPDLWKMIIIFVRFGQFQNRVVTHLYSGINQISGEVLISTGSWCHPSWLKRAKSQENQDTSSDYPYLLMTYLTIIFLIPFIIHAAEESKLIYNDYTFQKR
jgi:hypothetical protein